MSKVKIGLSKINFLIENLFAIQNTNNLFCNIKHKNIVVEMFTC